jgi:hypothetical protein
MSRVCSTHGRYEKYIQIWSKNLQGRERLEDLSKDGRVMQVVLKCMLKKWDVMVHNGFIRLRTGTIGEFL